MAMSSRVAGSSSATSVRKKRPDSSKLQHRPKSDTAAKKSRPQKQESDEKEEGITALEILAKAQEKDPSKVFDINLSSQKLTKIPDIKQFSKVRILDLSCNQITRISGLDNLNELKELKLYSNRIEDIKGLEKTKELHNLLLQHNRIKSIGKGLQCVRKLKTLRLDSNLLSTIDHREIGCCADLSTLDVSNNAITTLSAINCLTSLEELDASANRLTVVTDISRCRHLQELDLSRNNIHDLSGLKGLVYLTIIHLGNNQLTSLITMGTHKKLQELHAPNNKISSLTTIVQQFPVLEIFNISNNTIRSVEELNHLKQSRLVEMSVIGNSCISPDDMGYHQLIHQMIPSLELVDGVSLKRPSSSAGRTNKPLMRPMTASQVLSSRQVEEQLKAVVVEQRSFEESISRRFDSMKSLFDSLPKEAPKTSQQDPYVTESRSDSAYQSRPTSRCSSRSRIAEARLFASAHFQPEQG